MIFASDGRALCDMFGHLLESTHRIQGCLPISNSLTAEGTTQTRLQGALTQSERCHLPILAFELNLHCPLQVLDSGHLLNT
jgi:hypothetical protein